MSYIVCIDMNMFIPLFHYNYILTENLVTPFLSHLMFLSRRKSPLGAVLLSQFFSFHLI